MTLPRCICFALLSCTLGAQTPNIFEGGGDIGPVLHPGSVNFDPSTQRYAVLASGENVWGTTDAFYFIWKLVSDDVTLAADISFPETGGNPHKKAVLMMRQNLDADSAYADIAVHGNGLTSLQTRDAKGAATHEIESNLSAPRRVRLVKRGDYFYMQVGMDTEEPVMAGGAMKVPLTPPFYVGVGVSAHDKDAVEKAVFANVVLSLTPPRAATPTLYHTLETVSVTSTDRRVAYLDTHALHYPTWSPDGSSVIFLKDGHWMSVPLTGGQLSAVEAPSLTPGQSADGKACTLCVHNKDIFVTPVAGGSETRLTSNAGINRDPGFSPDGRYIYFSSTRSGTTQIWRMLADGSVPEPITKDDGNNEVPRVSPDGTRLFFVSMPRTDGVDITLRVITLATREVKTVTKLLHGQTSSNAPSWSPDSKRIAFIIAQNVY